MAKLMDIAQEWDVVIIGGGITGAGILHQVSRWGLRVLLIEQRDFAWGTSSRSSKLVHGGLRYLKQGQIFLTLDSVKERERMMAEAKGLVEPLEFMVPIFRDHGPPKWMIRAGLTIYDIMAGKIRHRFEKTSQILSREPHLRPTQLRGGFFFMDAQADDARMVQRLINEAVNTDVVALNYTAAIEIQRDRKEQVCGLVLRDTDSGQTRELHTRLVINATGAWAETLHPSPRPGLHIRPLRGSHLFFYRQSLPINHAISFTHPTDHRPVFAIPWENVILLGTTDVDHTEPLSDETYITPDEINYLLDAAHFIFPELRVSTTDVVSTLSGVRSVLSKGKRDASKESREHAVWHNQGLITVTGGKLTTFRKLAQSALKGAGSVLPTAKSRRCSTHPIYEQCEQTANHFNLPPDIWTRLWGRYGRATPTLLNASTTELLQPIASTQTLWAELLHAARHEQIRHLEDLLLRRTRIGLLLPQGGADLLDQIEEICTPALTWDQNRWTQERQRYLQTWQKHYAPPNAHK